MDRKVRVGGSFLKEFEVPYVASSLIASHVLDHELEDRQGIDCYDFAEIRFEAEQKRVVVATNIPTGVRAAVSQLGISLEVTDRVVSTRRFKSFFSG